jgi:hypothetical protein
MPSKSHAAGHFLLSLDGTLVRIEKPRACRST